MIISTRDYLPNQILPRYGNVKRELVVKPINNSYILTAYRCRKEINIPKKISLNNKDLIAIGLYLAEGKKERPHKNKKSNHNGEISFDSSDVNSLNLVCKLLEKFGIKREEIRTTLDLNVNYRKELSEYQLSKYWMAKLKLNPHNKRKLWLRYKGVEGGRLSKNSSHRGCIKLSFASVIFRNIFIPFTENFFKNMLNKKDKQAISLMLQGYFAGDGHVSFSKKLPYGRKHVEFLCNDPNLKSLLREGLSILGLTNIKETNPLTTKTYTHALRIYNRQDFLVLNKYRILNFVEYKREIFVNLLDRYQTRYNKRF